MPLTAKGEKVMKAMKAEYGAKKGESVFYASANAGKISGVHESRARKFRRAVESASGVRRLRRGQA